MSKKPDALGVFLAVVIAFTGIAVLMVGIVVGMALSWMWS